MFTHRESFETIIAKTEEKLSKCRIDYKQCFSAHRQNPTQHSLTQYIDAHNAYVQQLHATNAMLEAYNCETVPQLLQELEEIYTDLCNIVAEAIVQGAEAISTRVSVCLVSRYYLLRFKPAVYHYDAHLVEKHISMSSMQVFQSKRERNF